jgi:hypothetical protein
MRAETGQAPALDGLWVVVEHLRARHNEIALTTCDAIRAAVPDAVGAPDPAYQAGMLAAVNALVAYSFDAIQQGGPSFGAIPPEATAQARRAARAGVSLGAVLRRYVAGHRRLGELVAEETMRVGLASDAPAPAYIRKTQAALLEHLTAAIEREYDRERLRVESSPEQRRVDLVRDMLGGERAGPPDLDELRYTFDAWHLGLIATGESAQDALGRLRADRQLLAVSHAENVVWAWLGLPQRLVHVEIERLRLDGGRTGVTLAIGEPAWGLDGWRRTHNQAQQALQVALLAGQSRVRYADVAVLMPWLEDLDRADALVELYLSPLERQKDGGVAARRVLRAYFETARNVSAAACKLGVERRTLAYRLRAIEDCLGRRIDEQLVELEVAVRLHALLKRPKFPDRKESASRISTLA